MIPMHAVTLHDDGELRRLLRTTAISAGQNSHAEPLSVHVEVSGEPRPHRPDEMRPTVCINVHYPRGLPMRRSGEVIDPDEDAAFIEIDDPDALDQLIAALTTARPILRQLRKEA